MKRIKLFISIFSMILFCGCQANINVVVDTNLRINESIKITTNKDSVADYFTSIDDLKNNYKSLLNQYDDDYELDVYYEDNEAVGIIEKKEKLSKKSLKGFESLLFQSLNKDKNNYELVLSNEVIDYFNPELEMEIDESSLLDKIELNIQFHNVVTGANSDSYNSVTNTYTWIIDEKNLDRNIEFTITNEKRYDIIIPYLLKKYIGYVILGTLLIGILIFVLVIVNKSKRENEI